MVIEVPSKGLTSVEQALVDHVGRGERLDLAPEDEAVDEAAMRSWSDSRTCRATVIREILRGRLAADPDPHGLRLRGARIAGRLDLEGLTTDVNLDLKDCYLEEGVLARNAHLTSVLLGGCQIEHPAEPPLDATRLNCSVLVLDGARVVGHAEDGAVSVLLSGAHIGGSLECDGAKLRNDSGPALYADRLQVDQSMFISYGFTATGSSSYGVVYLVGAHISGHLDCTGADLCNDSGPALAAYSLQVGQGMYLTREFTAVGGGEGAAVDLTDARVGGKFLFAPARLEHKVDSHGRLEVDGLTYAGVPGKISAQGWAGSAAARHPPLCGAAVSTASRRLPGTGRRPASPRDLDGTTRRSACSCWHRLGRAVVGLDHQGHPGLWL